MSLNFISKAETPEGARTFFVSPDFYIWLHQVFSPCLIITKMNESVRAGQYEDVFVELLTRGSLENYYCSFHCAF